MFTSRLVKTRLIALTYHIVRKVSDFFYVECKFLVLGWYNSVRGCVHDSMNVPYK